MKKKEFENIMFEERLTTEILYAGLRIGDVTFLETACDILGVDNKRIKETGKKCHKISPNPSDAGYETVICIVVRAICRAGNTKLREALIDFYLKKFPQIRDKATTCGNEAERLFRLYREGLNKQKYSIIDFQRQSFNLFYMASNSGGRTAEELARMWKEYQEKYPDSHYKEPEWRFYDNLNSIEESTHWLKRSDDTSLFYSCGLLQKLEFVWRRDLAEYLGIEPEMLERHIIRCLLLRMPDVYGGCEHISWDLDCLDTYDYMNDVLKRHHMSPVILRAENITEYATMLKSIMRQICMESIYYMNSLYSAKVVEKVEDVILAAPYAFLGELMSRFLFECHMDHQQKVWDEYYKHFSFAGTQGYSNLKAELSQCRKKLQQYDDADAERRCKENKEAKAAERHYIEKIALLEKELEKCKEEAVNQKGMLADRDTYISLLESGNEPENSAESVDFSKLYSSRILFVGGLPEMISRLKAVFSTATFVDNETMAVPQKTDLIVLLTGHMNHVLYYKYIGLARDKGIKVTYCNGSNIESITSQVVSRL